ncbi:LysR family transcriptional regulator [Streptomyces uncialis]|uniref:LysR family transcriptional regulator n=1 Tax=Streptomyces uncialis TaxID=1048205 RepID=UPI0038709D06|nr:LysR family transcriptional regulator [Streptomyces uncialis]
MLERLELQVFLTLAEELHFGRTAERLHVTTGRVSQILKKLEGRVGTLLFDRSSRTVELTEIGRQLRDDLQSGYEQIETGLARASQAARGSGSSLRVGFVGALAGQVMHRAAQRFTDDELGAPVTIREVQVVDALARLRGGHLDVLVISLPLSAPDITVGPVLFSEARMLAVPAGHPLATRASVTMEDLVGIVVLRPTDTTPGAWPADRHPRRTPSGSTIVGGPRVDTFQEALQQAGAGAGAVIVGAQVLRFYSRPDVVYVPFSDAPPIEWAATWLKTNDVPRNRSFARIAQEIGSGFLQQ